MAFHQTLTSDEAREKVRNTIVAAIGSLSACLDNHDTILAWTNGLAVAFDVFGNPRAVGLDKAPIVTPNRNGFPTIANGNGEIAQPMRRSYAVAMHLPTVVELLQETYK